MRWQLTVLALTSGCHILFSVDGIRDDEGVNADAGADADTCSGPGHDEDDDGRPDHCDRCPISPQDTIDTDGDELPDACDPDPAAPNRILWFETFETLNSELAFVGGFSARGDALVARGAGASMVLVPTPTGLGRVWVMAGVDVSGLIGGAFREVGVIFDAVKYENTVNGTYCVLGRVTSDYVMVYKRERPAEDTIVDAAGPLLEIDQLHDGVLRASSTRTAEDTTTVCQFQAGDTTSQIAGTRVPAPPEGGVGLYTLDVDADFRYLLVVGPH